MLMTELDSPEQNLILLVAFLSCLPFWVLLTSTYQHIASTTLEHHRPHLINMRLPFIWIWPHLIAELPEWYRRRHDCSATGNLYYGQEPVAGIYSLTQDSERWLGAVRPRAGKVSRKGLCCEGKPGSVKPVDPLEGVTRSRASSTSSSHGSSAAINSMASIFSVLSKRSLTFTELRKLVNGFSTSRASRRARRQQTISPLKTDGLCRFEINGYKLLNTSLQIEYRRTTDRWIIVSDIKVRTRIVVVYFVVT